MKRFFDTNILVYAFLDVDKRDQAVAVLAEGGRISAQVLNEFTNVARQKRQRPWSEIEAAITVIREGFPDIVPLTEQTHASALALARDHGACSLSQRGQGARRGARKPDSFRIEFPLFPST